MGFSSISFKASSEEKNKQTGVCIYANKDALKKLWYSVLLLGTSRCLTNDCGKKRLLEIFVTLVAKVITDKKDDLFLNNNGR